MADEIKSNDFNVVVYHDLSKVSDVVLINSGTLIARGETANRLLEVKVVGDVMIWWKDPDSDRDLMLYLYPSEFPKALTDFINSSRNWDLKTVPGQFELDSKNRFEFSICNKKGSEVEKIAVSEEDLCGKTCDEIKAWMIAKYVRVIEQISDTKKRERKIQGYVHDNPDIFI